MTCLFSTAYWPNLYYCLQLLHAEDVVLEQHEHYQKQSYRNRTTILSANGPLDLTIPIVNTGAKQLSKEVRISYKENWQVKHWRAIVSAYKNSPYFEHFEPEIAAFYQQQTDLLMDYNEAQLKTLLALLRQKKNIHRSTRFDPAPVDAVDLRDAIHPKRVLTGDEIHLKRLHQPYYQVFGHKLGFHPNLSVLDLFFNTGLGTLTYLKPNA